MYFSFQAFHRAINMAVLHHAISSRAFAHSSFISQNLSVLRFYSVVLSRRTIYFALNLLLLGPITNKLPPVRATWYLITRHRNIYPLMYKDMRAALIISSKQNRLLNNFGRAIFTISLMAFARQESSVLSERWLQSATYYRVIINLL